jgi:hypothetical protein
MPMTLHQQGQLTVARDSEGRVIEKAVGSIQKRSTWRSLLRKMTDNGAELYGIMLEIARGKPFTARLEDGRESEPIVPTPAVRLAAAKELVEFLHGKAVPQHLALQAEEEAQRVEQMQAMTDDQLWAIVHDKAENFIEGGTVDDPSAKHDHE